MEWDKEKLDEFLRLAERGDRYAQYRLGEYCEGKDVARAADWYRKAAEQGHPSAQVALGDLYANGRGVGKDLDAAVSWYCDAARQGDKAAILALIRTPPDATPKQSLDRVIASCRKAASDGDAGALCWLGIAYERGIGVETDTAFAGRLYHKAAALGHHQAYLLLKAMAAHNAAATRLVESLEHYTRKYDAVEDCSTRLIPKKPQEDRVLLAALRRFILQVLVVLFWVALAVGSVYVLVKLVKWAWNN